MSTFKIYGLLWDDSEQNGSENLVWRTELKKPPFYYLGNFCIGISEKAIFHAQQAGVYKFIVKCNGEEYDIRVPSPKSLKEKKKMKMFEERKSLFAGSPPIIIYYFKVGINTNQLSIL